MPRCQASHIRSSARKPRSKSRRSGFTLLEVLIATAVTLLMMVSLAQIFKTIGDSMKQGRAALELNNRLRSVVYRIRSDLENATALPRPPADPSAGQGYFEYFDGSTTDYTGAVLTQVLNSDGDATNDIQDASRYGDFDDILMFTARAGDTWFTGKVPRFVLAGSVPSAPEDYELVTIASQYAEIAIFAEPLVSNVGNPNRDPSALVADPSGFEDTNNDNLPDNIRLHIRQLLVRPDLDLSSLPLAQQSSSDYRLSNLVVNGVSVPFPVARMAIANQFCDVSMRYDRALNSVASNSLQDLVDPANRFAHVQFDSSTGDTRTMPLLALGNNLTAHDNLGLSSYGGQQASTRVGAGFLHPVFTLWNPNPSNVAISSPANALLSGFIASNEDRTGEDILATNVLSFDVKAFDPSVALLLHPGPDGNPQSGAAGTDDQIMSPNDPGYAAAILLGSSVAANGEFVDLGWARKIVDHWDPAVAPPAVGFYSSLESSLSGFTSSGQYTDSLLRSGCILGSGTSKDLVRQIRYDTWTTSYEGDALLQAELGSTRGLYTILGSSVALRDPWRSSNIDAGTDGIDNAGSAAGVDDPSELETSPPFPVDLRGIKVTVRMEDPATRQIKQMSVGKEFVTP